jgi:hypothetical protein
METFPYEVNLEDFESGISIQNFPTSDFNNNSSSFLNSDIDLEKGLLEEEIETYHLSSNSSLKMRFKNFKFKFKTKAKNLMSNIKDCIIDKIACFLKIIEFLDKMNKEYINPLISTLEKVEYFSPTKTSNLIKSVINKIKDLQRYFKYIMDAIGFLKELFAIHPIIGIICTIIGLYCCILFLPLGI